MDKVLGDLRQWNETLVTRCSTPISSNSSVVSWERPAQIRGGWEEAVALLFECRCALRRSRDLAAVA